MSFLSVKVGVYFLSVKVGVSFLSVKVLSGA